MRKCLKRRFDKIGQRKDLRKVLRKEERKEEHSPGH
jgi:hypothetical protein